MLSGLFGQFVGGVVWAIGANTAAKVLRGEDTENVREVTKMAVKTYLTLAGRVQTAAGEIAAGFEQVVAEAEAEVQADVAPVEAPSEQP
jgi:hypothetical protein